MKRTAISPKPVSGIRCAIVGGGSLFTLALLEGIAVMADPWRDGPLLTLSLVDLTPERCERWRAYGGLLARTHGLPLNIEVPTDPADALRDAAVVLLSFGNAEAETLAERVRDEFGFDPHSIHDGPPAFAYSALAWPTFRHLGEETARLAPDGWIIVLPNPTDVLAEAIEVTTGIQSVGLCVEVPHTREHLAYYWGVDPDEIVFEHAGVNHDGWVLRFTIQGESGYGRWDAKILDLPNHPDFHPGNHGFVEAYRMTGRLRASIFHNGPLRVDLSRSARKWESFGVPRREILQRVDQAILDDRPLDAAPRGAAPEDRPVKYLGTGIALSRLLYARATGCSTTLALQVRNRGAVANFPSDTRVEIPAMVSGDRIEAMPVGELPEWLGGMTRLFAIQRRLSARYLIDGDPETLRQALFTLPGVAPIDVLHRFAEEVHRIRGRTEV